MKKDASRLDCVIESDGQLTIDAAITGRTAEAVFTSAYSQERGRAVITLLAGRLV
jgi:hypothetical protein